VHLAFAAAARLLAWLAPALAAVGAVPVWAYQIGSARLGVVDLIACEVSTLCRIVTILDTVRRFTDNFSLGVPAQAKGRRRAIIDTSFHIARGIFSGI
jgi:hypothetical protein